jgi:hypothetical protein
MDNILEDSLTNNAAGGLFLDGKRKLNSFEQE